MIDKAMSPHDSGAQQPNIDWSHVRETVRMLELAALQIEAAMTESNASVEVLTESFTSMASHLRTITDTVQTLPDVGPVGTAKQSLDGIAEHVSRMVRQAIIAFQFYDKLVQRLSHVGLSLGALSDLLGDGQRQFDPGAWMALQEKIRVKYSTREEIAMFDTVMKGLPVHAAIAHFMAEMKERNDDIELF